MGIVNSTVYKPEPVFTGLKHGKLYYFFHCYICVCYIQIDHVFLHICTPLAKGSFHLCNLNHVRIIDDINFSNKNFFSWAQLICHYNPGVLPRFLRTSLIHYKDVIMSAMAFQIYNLTIVYSSVFSGADRRKHQSSALLAICAGNSPVSAQRPMTRSFDVFFDLSLNNRLCKQWWGWWFEMPPRSLWCHYNFTFRFLPDIPLN